MLKRQMWKVRNAVFEFIHAEDGMAVIEVVLIIVVFIALVLIFKDQMTDLLENIFDTITSQSSSV